MSFNIYLDESSQNAHRYMLIGATIAAEQRVHWFTEKVLEIKGTSSKPLKWTNIKRHQTEKYENFVNFIFDSIERNNLHLHTVAIDCSGLDHNTYNDGDRDLGFNKFIYQLLLHRFGVRYPKPLYVYIDQRCTNQSQNELKEILNNGCGLYGVVSKPFRRVRMRTYKDVPLLWPADLVIGAMAYFKNNHQSRDDAAHYKRDIASLVLQRAGIEPECRDTPRNKRFTVWNFQLRERATGPR